MGTETWGDDITNPRVHNKDHDDHNDKRRRWRSSMVEQLICNQQVAGSSPIASSVQGGEAVESTHSARDLASTVAAKDLEGFPSGQRDQTVNLASLTSKVRILPPPRRSHVETRAQRKQLAGVAQLVELQPSKLDVAGSNPVSRSHDFGSSITSRMTDIDATVSERTATKPDHDTTTGTAHLAQLVEHVLGKDEVTSSILVVGSRRTDAQVNFTDTRNALSGRT
jgi:hypothetical protein